jgi:PAS domain S-box-containing protein
VSGEPILIVEDEGLVALDLEERLVRMGYRVTGRCASGADAIAAAERTRPDLVLMDVALRGPVDGITAAAEIRRRTAASILYLTAHADEATVARAAATEPVGFLVKPIEDRQLRSVVEVGLVRATRERELRERESRFAAILQSIADGVIATDASWRVTFLNPVAERLTGCSRELAVGRPLDEVYRPVDPNVAAVNPLTRVIHPRLEDRPAPTTALLSRDGTSRTIDDSAVALLDAGGLPNGVVVTFRDVSDRKRVEAALRRSSALREAIMEAALECILITDRQGRVLASNPAAERVLGRPASALSGSSVLDLFVSTVRDEIRRSLARATPSSDAPLLGRRIVSTAVMADGHRIPVEFALVSLNLGGPEHFAIFLRALDAATSA